MLNLQRDLCRFPGVHFHVSRLIFQESRLVIFHSHLRHSMYDLYKYVSKKLQHTPGTSLHTQVAPFICVI